MFEKTTDAPMKNSTD